VSLDERIRTARTELEKKLMIVGELTRQLAAEGVYPIIVGGTAVEVYSTGEYQTHDVDLVVAARERAVQALESMGFERKGRVWHHPRWDAVLEIPDVQLASDMARVNRITIDDYQVYCIGLEDLIIDRLNAAQHRGSREDRRWAAILLRAYRDELDMDYLKARAVQESIDSLLNQLLEEAAPDG
jgi:predicted nucleotidyltransferase